MARRTKVTEVPDDISEVVLAQLEDIARGFEGSSGDVTLSSQLADCYEKLGGDISKTTDIGNGGVLVNAADLCNLVLGEVLPPEEGRRRAIGLPRRAGTVRSRRAVKEVETENVE